MITPRKIKILEAVGRYYTLTRSLMQDVCDEPNDRVMRKNLQQLVQAGLLNKTRMEVVNPLAKEGPMPVYYPSRKGLEFLAAHTGDESWTEKCCLTPNWQHLLHWTTVARWHILLDRAAALSAEATIGGWFGEWDVINPDEKEPHKRYRLFQLPREKPRLVCNPDAAFLLCVGKHAKIHALEIDRETSSISQIVNSKPQGFAAVAERQLHRRWFETTSDSFWVLSVSYTPNRRDLLVKAMRGKPGAQLWKFAAWSELTPVTLLTGPVWHRTEGEPGPLVKTAESPVSGTKSGSAGGPGRVRPTPAAERETV